MIQFQMAIIRKGPNWTEDDTPATKHVRQQHLEYATSLINSGKAVLAGPFADGSGILGIFILRASTPQEARKWVDDDPAAKAGFHVSEIHPWWSQDIFGKPKAALTFETVYLGLLKSGPNRKPGDDNSPEIQELQKAHLANINRLAALKKLVAAGPFGDDGELRGIFVFRVHSLQEAQELAATDPMIKIDRLRVELHPWLVSEGALP